jgi:hypothetical protein
MDGCRSTLPKPSAVQPGFGKVLEDGSNSLFDLRFTPLWKAQLQIHTRNVRPFGDRFVQDGPNQCP